MGIPGLWKFVDPATRVVTLEEYRGKKIAVDVYGWYWSISFDIILLGFIEDAIFVHGRLEWEFQQRSRLF